jgi:hypothetical protein
VLCISWSNSGSKDWPMLMVGLLRREVSAMAGAS